MQMALKELQSLRIAFLLNAKPTQDPDVPFGVQPRTNKRAHVTPTPRSSAHLSRFFSSGPSHQQKVQMASPSIPTFLENSKFTETIPKSEKLGYLILSAKDRDAWRQKSGSVFVFLYNAAVFSVFYLQGYTGLSLLLMGSPGVLIALACWLKIHFSPKRIWIHKNGKEVSVEMFRMFGFASTVYEIEIRQFRGLKVFSEKLLPVPLMVYRNRRNRRRFIIYSVKDFIDRPSMVAITTAKEFEVGESMPLQSHRNLEKFSKTPRTRKF